MFSRSWCQHFLFEQPLVHTRLRLARMILGGVILLWILTGPKSAYYQLNESTLFAPSVSWLPPLASWFLSIKVATVLAALASLLPRYWRMGSILLALGWSVLNFTMMSFHESYSVETNHLVFFAWVMALAPASKKPEATARGSAILAFMILYVGLLYLQAGSTKLIHSGWEWFATGQTIYVRTIVEGTNLGRFFAQWPWLFPLFGLSTAIFEFLMPWLVLLPRAYPLFVACCLSFHLGTYCFLGISFWFLWPFYLPLFLLPWPAWSQKFHSSRRKCYFR